MTLQQAILNAERAGLRVAHPNIQGGLMIALKDLDAMAIPLRIAADNLWELEARTCHINENTAKATVKHVLKKYVPLMKVDEMAEAIVSEFFAEHV